ncbi:hypothetical protein B0H11DRAFT_1941338 [Mycena galericulata]|nr:hypothetical protein B0H11DRAFT_1941338 [Mycena galericulata]
MIPDDGFPVELEREIFEIAALQYPQVIPTLLRVACRVRIWCVPTTYRSRRADAAKDRTSDVLSFKGDKLSPGLEISVPKPDSIFLEGVHSLLLYQSVDSEDMLAILRICAKTTNLSVYNDNVDPSLCPYISAMPLKKLAINFRRLMSNPVRLQDTCGELFSHLTHLDIITAVGDEEPWEQWSSLSHLPSLTHLSFNYGLPCFLVQAYKNAVLDWEAGATGGQDFWERADAFFDKKQKREIDLHIIHRPNGPLAAEV